MYFRPSFPDRKTHSTFGSSHSALLRSLFDTTLVHATIFHQIRHNSISNAQTNAMQAIVPTIPFHLTRRRSETIAQPRFQQPRTNLCDGHRYRPRFTPPSPRPTAKQSIPSPTIFPSACWPSQPDSGPVSLTEVDLNDRCNARGPVHATERQTLPADTGVAPRTRTRWRRTRRKTPITPAAKPQSM